jgi:NitT/TauT family transport system substrate-binding protein
MRKKYHRSIPFTVLLALIVISAILTGCVSPAADQSKASDTSAISAVVSSRPEIDFEDRPLVRLGVLKGPTGIGMAKLLKDHTDRITYNRYETTISGSPDAIVAKITTGELDIAAVPTNLAATLFNKTNGQIQLLAINTLGVLHILEKGDAVQNLEDLKGKTLYATGKGSVPEYVLNYLLIQNGLDPAKDLTIEYKTEHTELATLAASGRADLVLLPEPFVTTVLSQNVGFRRAIDITTEWADTMDRLELRRNILSMGCVIVRKDFAENNRDTVNDFLSEYETSINYVTENHTQAAEIIAEYDILPSASVAKMAIPGSNIIFIEGEVMKNQIMNFYNILFIADPKSIGGAMPGDDFFYIR